MSVLPNIMQETQQIIATNDFDGTVPTVGTDDLDSGELKYAPASAGGKFRCPIARDGDKLVIDPAVSKHARRVIGIKVYFGGQSAWDIHIEDVAGNEVLWITGTTEADLVVTDSIELNPDESLKLTTTGASTAMLATVTYELSRKMG